MPAPAPFGPLVPCPGLAVVPGIGLRFTDCLGRVHDLERQPTRTITEAAADARLLGTTYDEICILVRTGALYPVIKRNERSVLLYDCALTDWHARQLLTKPLIHRPAPLRSTPP